MVVQQIPTTGLLVQLHNALEAQLQRLLTQSSLSPNNPLSNGPLLPLSSVMNAKTICSSSGGAAEVQRPSVGQTALL